MAQTVKESACNAGDLSLIPGSGRSPEEGSGIPLQYSCLENPMNRGAWGGYSPWGHKESGTAEQLHIAEFITRNAGLPESQAGLKIARRNINYLRYADDTILRAERRGTKELLEGERGE